jgi:hypothetical protein
MTIYWKELVNFTIWITIKREQPLHYCTYLNNNRRKQDTAQREQLTLCSTHASE